MKQIVSTQLRDHGDLDKLHQHKGNNFSLLRLLLASLVIVSHSPELVDGNRSRELLTRAFGTISFGGFAVDGFFIISGFLITKSFAQKPNISTFIKNRMLRILPGYLVAAGLCFFFLAPLAGATLSVFSVEGSRLFVTQITRLVKPDVPGTFAPLPYHMINGSMWTIAYEVRCYIVVAVFGLFFRHLPFARSALVALVVALLALNGSGLVPERHIPFEWEIGEIGPDVRFGSLFGVGALFYVLRSAISISVRGAWIAAVLLLVCMPSKYLAEPAIALFGGYLLFFAASRSPSRFSLWADKTDISYGLYLYAWPIGSFIILADRNINPWLLCVLTLILSAVAGLVSWLAIEKPMNKLARSTGRLDTVFRRAIRTA